MQEELILDARIDNLERVLSFVDEYLEQMDCPLKKQMQIDVSVEEIFVNVASYAYSPKIGPVTVRLVMQQNPREVSITFIDRGIPYNPLKKPDPDLTLPVETRKIGGLGIYMVKKSVDDISYEYRDGQNILTIKKKL